jgi:DNA primase
VISDSVSLRKAGTRKRTVSVPQREIAVVHRQSRQGIFSLLRRGAGGDVFKFIELQDKIGFPEAARTLAQRFGVPIPELEAERRSAADGGRARGARQDSRAGELTHIASSWNRRPEGAHSPVSRRNSAAFLTRPWRRCNSAFAPQGRGHAAQRLVEADFTPPQLFTSGLVTKRDDGKRVGSVSQIA